jgi:hypothetical protein
MELVMLKMTRKVRKEAQMYVVHRSTNVSCT